MELVKKVAKCLKNHPEKRFEAREIAEWISKTYPDECRKKQAKSQAKVFPVDTKKGLINQITSEIGASRSRLQKDNPNIKVTEDRPKKYYFSKRDDADDIKEAKSPKNASASKTDTSASTEHDLYPKLADFLWSEFALYSKRIDENSSSNKRKGTPRNKWLHPDLVGMEDLSKDWDKEITDCVKVYADKRTKLWSFEVKKEIDLSNVRESFFQTVSNSSWANFGYLVAGGYDNPDTLKELRMLASLHGIGFIHLNVDDPSQKSEIMIPAKEREEINWDAVNRLAEENDDFMGYIEAICHFNEKGKIRPLDWYIT